MRFILVAAPGGVNVWEWIAGAFLYPFVPEAVSVNCKEARYLLRLNSLDTMRAMRIEIKRLIKQAERDLENAKKNIRIEAYEVAAFLAEQAVEKYLKAYWMLTKKEAAPFTHSLTELGDALGVPRMLRKHLVSLTADYTMARCPDAANGIPYEIYDRETAEAKVSSAEAILAWLRQQTSD